MIININIPSSWQQLSQRQLRQLFQTMADVQQVISDDLFKDISQYSAAESSQVKAYCLFLWSGLRVVCRYGDDFLVAVGKADAILRVEDVTDAIAHLDWIDSIPDCPVRLDSICAKKCYYLPDLSDMNFETWLALDNLWTGFTATHSIDCIVQMIGLCYHRPKKPKAFELLSMMYWWAAVKNMMARKYPDFFSGAPSSDAPDYNAIRKNIDTQIRALTKGDPTKEAQVLSLRVDRALAELDAQAREAKELERISKS